MPAPAWLVSLLVRGIVIGVRRLRARKHRKQIEQLLKEDGPLKFLSELGFLTGARTKIGAWLLIIGVVVEGLLQVLPGLTGVIGWAGPLLHALTPVGAALAALGIRYKGTSPTP